MYHSMIKTTQKESSVIVLLTGKVRALGIKHFPVSKFLLFSDLSGKNYMQITDLTHGILLTITKVVKDRLTISYTCMHNVFRDL